MPSIRTLVGAGFLLAAPVLAHMQLSHPAPFNATNNPHVDTAADPYLIFPYDCCGPNDRWMYPCRGYHDLLGTPEGAPTASWEAGTTVQWSLTGDETLGGNHYGGSCQVGFSTDQGNTFHVVTSYEGNCPHRNGGVDPDGQTFSFTVPSDLDVGVQIFAWIWFNREQEFNMNCAAVEITPMSSTSSLGARSSDEESSMISKIASHARSFRQHDHALLHHHHTRDISTLATSPNFVAFSDRPHMLVADNGNGCLTPHTTAEVKYPQPGPDVVFGDGEYPVETPTGNCDASGMLLRQAYYG